MANRFWIYSSVGACALAALAFAPESPSRQVAGLQGTRSPAETIATPGRQPLPYELSRPMLETAARDPFAAFAPPVMIAPVARPIKVAPPPPPSPPALNLRFTGRMTTPDGSQVIFASMGDTPLSLSPGQTLPNGYQVTAIHEQYVELSYLPMNFKTRFDLPAVPKYEIR